MNKKQLIERWNEGEGVIKYNKIMEWLKGNINDSFIDDSYYYKNKIDLRGIVFEDFIEINDMNLDNIDFSYCNFNRALMKRCKINNCIYIACDLSYVSEWQCEVSNSTFSKCKIKGSIGIWGGTYNNVIFEKDDLKGVTIGYPDFYNCLFNNCKLDQVDFNGANFNNVKFIGKLKDVWFRGNYLPNVKLYEKFDKKRAKKSNDMIVDFSEAELEYPNFRNNCDLSKVIVPKYGEYLLIDDIKAVIEILKTLINGTKEENIINYCEFLLKTRFRVLEEQNMTLVNVEEMKKTAMKYVSIEEFDNIINKVKQ